MPVTITKNEPMPAITKRERVAAYARVSTGKDAMLHSLSAQVSYYSQTTQQNPAWEYAGVYVDEALTGTKDTRPEFQRMLADCKAGKIDRILTKSLSRFARNTVTVLESVRMLKSLGVDVYFEEGNIHSIGADSELILTLLASFAQEESLSVSENQKWRIRKGFEKGEVMCWRFMLGYRIEHGAAEIDPDGAEIVRDIFHRAIAGESYGSICRRLNAQGKTGALGKPFRSAHIRDILTNEKYLGNALLQKTFVRDHLSKQRVVNQGELPKYYATETHPAIIDEVTFEAAQEIVRQHAEKRSHCNKPQRSEFTSKILCPFCGAYYKRVTSKGMFLKAYNRLMRQRKQLIEDCELMKSLLTDCTEQEAGIEQLRQEIEEIADMTQNFVRQNTRQSQSQENYNAKYNALAERYEKASAKHNKLEAEVARRKNKARQIAAFIDQLEKAPASLEEWDSQVWSLLLEKGTVNRDGSITFEFRNGKEIRVEAK